MTEKTLSEKICEECGIEYEREVIDPLYKSMCNEGDPRCTQISKTIKKKLDFQNNNNNFGKLINILHKNDFVISNEGYPSKENFVICLLSDLLNAIDCEDSGWILKLKQAIRQADWEY